MNEWCIEHHGKSGLTQVRQLLATWLHHIAVHLFATPPCMLALPTVAYLLVHLQPPATWQQARCAPPPLPPAARVFSLCLPALPSFTYSTVVYFLHPVFHCLYGCLSHLCAVQACRDSTVSLAEAEQTILEFVQQHAPEPGTAQARER